jgi:hypothetical protein
LTRFDFHMSILRGRVCPGPLSHQTVNLRCI